MKSDFYVSCNFLFLLFLLLSFGQVVSLHHCDIGFSPKRAEKCWAGVQLCSVFPVGIGLVMCTKGNIAHGCYCCFPASLLCMFGLVCCSWAEKDGKLDPLANRFSQLSNMVRCVYESRITRELKEIAPASWIRPQKSVDQERIDICRQIYSTQQNPLQAAYDELRRLIGSINDIEAQIDGLGESINQIDNDVCSCTKARRTELSDSYRRFYDVQYKEVLQDRKILEQTCLLVDRNLN